MKQRFERCCLSKMIVAGLFFLLLLRLVTNLRNFTIVTRYCQLNKEITRFYCKREYLVGQQSEILERNQTKVRATLRRLSSWTWKNEFLTNPVKALVDKTITGVINVLGPDSVTMTATLASGDALPSWITYNTVSGELSILATSTIFGSFTVQVKGTRESVDEIKTVNIEAWQWTEYTDGVSTDPYSLESSETRLVNPEYTLTSMTINRSSVYTGVAYRNWQIGLRLTFTKQTGDETLNLDFGNFYKHNQELYNNGITTEERFPVTTTAQITKKVTVLEFCSTTDKQFLHWIRFGFEDGTTSPDLGEGSTCRVSHTYNLNGYAFAGLSVKFTSDPSRNLGTPYIAPTQIGVWVSTYSSGCYLTPKKLTFVKELKSFIHSINYSASLVQDFQTDLPSACVTYTLSLQDSTGTSIATPTWVTFNLALNQFSISPTTSVASATYTVQIIATSKVLSSLEARTTAVTFEITSTQCVLTSLSAPYVDQTYDICSFQTFKFTEGMVQTPNCNLQLSSYTLTVVNGSSTTVTNGLANTVPTLTLKTCILSTYTTGQLSVTYLIKVGLLEATNTITIKVRHDCEGTSIQGYVDELTYIFGTSDAILTATIGQNQEIWNTIATSHADTTYCGAYAYLLQDTTLPISVSSDGQISVSANGTLRTVVSLELTISLQYYSTITFITPLKVTYVCKLTETSVTTTQTTYSYYLNSPATSYQLTIAQTPSCTYPVRSSVITCSEKPGQSFLEAQTEAGFKIFTSSPADVGTYSFNYKVYQDNQWDQALENLSTSFDMTVIILHDCELTTLSDYTASDFVYYIGEETLTVTMAIQNSVGTSREDSQYCGPIELVQTSEFTYVSTDGNKLSIYSTSDSDIGRHTIELSASLKNYSMVPTKTYQANVNIQKCSQPVLVGNGVSDQTFELDPESTENKEISIPTYSSSCDKTIKISLTEDNGKDVSMITVLQNQGLLKVSLKKKSYIGVYNVRIVASIEETEAQNNQATFKLTITCTLVALYVDARNVSDRLYSIQSDITVPSVVSMSPPTYVGKPAYCMDAGYSLQLFSDYQPTQTTTQPLPEFISFTNNMIIEYSSDIVKNQLISISTSDISFADKTYSFTAVASANADPSIQNSSVTFKVTFTCDITELKPVYTDSTVFQASYMIRGPSQTLSLPQYTWSPLQCRQKIVFKLVNLTFGWDENVLPGFFKPDLDKGIVLLDGKLFKESFKVFRFRLIAKSVTSQLSSRDYEFTIQTDSFFNTPPIFIAPIQQQAIIPGLDFSWTLPKMKDEQGDLISSVQVKIGENYEWLSYDDQRMTFKAVGDKTRKQEAAKRKIQIILTDQYGAEATYIQGIELIGSQNQTNVSGAKINKGKQVFFDENVCSNSSLTNTTNVNCTKSEGPKTTKDMKPKVNKQQSSGGYFVVPIGVPGQMQMNKELADQFAQQILDAQNNSQATTQKPPEPKKLQITFKQFEFGCGFDIYFSEPIDVNQPNFKQNLQGMFIVTMREQTKKQSRRQLRFNFKPGLVTKQQNSEQEFTDYKGYEVNIAVDDDGLKITYAVNLTDPLDISVGDKIHYLSIEPGDFSFLRGKDAPLMVPFIQSIKFQLRSQIKANEVGSLATVSKTTSQAAKATIIVSLILSFLMGSSLSTVWSMVGSLQNIALMAFVNVTFPGNGNTFINRVYWISSFDIIPTEIIDWWARLWVKLSSRPVEDQTMNDRFSQRFFQMGMTNSNPMFNLAQSGILIFLLVIEIIIILILPLLIQRCVNKTTSKVTAYCEKRKQNLFWSFQLRLFIELYIDIAVAGLIRIRTNEWDLRYERAMTVIGWLFIAFAVIFPFIIFGIVWHHRNTIQSEEFETRFGELIDSLKTTENKARYYWCFYIFQRLFECILIVQSQSYCVFQIQGFFYASITQVIFVGWVYPFQDRVKNRIELLNSTVALFSCYFLLLFTAFLPNNKVRYNSAWGLIAVVVLMIAINIAFTILENYIQIYRSLKIKYLKLKAYLRRNKMQRLKQEEDLVLSSEVESEKQSENQSDTERMNQVACLLSPPKDKEINGIPQLNLSLEEIEENEQSLTRRIANDQLLQSAKTMGYNIDSLRAQSRENTRAVIAKMMKSQENPTERTMKMEEEIQNIEEETAPIRLNSGISTAVASLTKLDKALTEEFLGSQLSSLNLVCFSDKQN